MDIKFEIEPIFKIEFFKIKCIDFKNKKEHIEEVLKMFQIFPNFYSNRNKADFTCLQIVIVMKVYYKAEEIFKDEFILIRAKY